MVTLIRTFFDFFWTEWGEGAALFFAWYVTVFIEIRFRIQMRSVGTPSLCSFSAHADIFGRDYEQRM